MLTAVIVTTGYCCSTNDSFVIVCDLSLAVVSMIMDCRKLADIDTGNSIYICDAILFLHQHINS